MYLTASRPAEHPPFRAHGFTLIELMITVAIVAILAAVAYPSYASHMRKSRRAVAAGCLLELAQHMERRYTVNMSYLTLPAATAGAAAAAEPLPISTCRTDLREFYEFSFAASEPTASTFTLQALPAGTQAADADTCGTLTINHQGTRGARVNSCWP